MKRATELRLRLWTLLAHGGLITAGMTAAGCASAVAPAASDGGPDATAQTPPDATMTTMCAATDRRIRECLTMAEVEARLRQVPRFGDAGSADSGPITTPREANGCYVPSAVLSSCCNPAISVAREGDACCYQWCEMGCCGRPLLVEGTARIAALCDSDAWAGSERAPVAGLDAVTRAALAHAWRADALLEHASVASFARFTLELIAAGAPPDLLADAQRAGLDEIEHARICFALATALDGARMGPGRLELHGALLSDSLEAAVRSAIAEGCVGETVASLLASAQCDAAEDASTRAGLERIARDEGTHAQLAWRFIAWAIRVGGESVRRAAIEAFSDALAGAVRVPAAPAGVDSRGWREYGRLTTAEATAVIDAARNQVIRPCADALLLGVVPIQYAAEVASHIG